MPVISADISSSYSTLGSNVSVLGTFNGWTIISMPSMPAWRQLDFTASDAVTVNQSPFTAETQVQYWLGADLWSVKCELPPMSYANAKAWIAFLLACQGRLNVFSIGDPLGSVPQGIPLGTPVVYGTNTVSSFTLVTSGWEISSSNLLYPGDYIQIGYRLHVVTSTVNSDSSGCATLKIWPSLREAPTAGDAVITANTTGLFRLASNTRNFTIPETRVVGLSFSCSEAR
jgi:hypothetical protein